MVNGKRSLLEGMGRDEKKALGLYVILARDAGDFADRVRVEDMEPLELLHVMLTTPREGSDMELNKIGAAIVKRELEGRNDEKDGQ